MVHALESVAISLGYHTLKLDTLERLPSAIRLYSKCGYIRCSPYVHNPMPDCVFMSKELATPQSVQARLAARMSTELLSRARGNAIDELSTRFVPGLSSSRVDYF